MWSSGMHRPAHTAKHKQMISIVLQGCMAKIKRVLRKRMVPSLYAEQATTTVMTTCPVGQGQGSEA